MKLMNEIASPIPFSPANDNFTSTLQAAEISETNYIENSKIIFNNLIKDITKENKEIEKQKENSLSESLPVFLYEFFIFELYTPKEIFKTLHQPILAFRLLDFPTLSVEGRIDKQKELVIFNQGKSSFFEMELGILKDYLANEPLYVMFIDLNFGDMKIIGSSRVNISIFNHEHFLSLKNKNDNKSAPKSRRNLLKLFDKAQTVIAEFDICLLIRREFFKYDSKKEIFDKLNIDGLSRNQINDNNVYNGFSGENFSNQFNSENYFNDVNKNHNFSNNKGNFASHQTHNEFFNNNKNCTKSNFDFNNCNNFQDASNINQFNNVKYFHENAVDEFIDYNYNKKFYNESLKKSYTLAQSNNINFPNRTDNNFKKMNESNFCNKSVNVMQKLSNVKSKNSIYNPNKENIQNLLNPSQGKSFVNDLKDLLDGGNKQPPPLYFNNKRLVNEENYSAVSPIMMGKIDQSSNLIQQKMSNVNFNSEDLEKEIYEAKLNKEKLKVFSSNENHKFTNNIKTNNKFENSIDQAEEFIEHLTHSNHENSGSKKTIRHETGNQNNKLRNKREEDGNINMRYDKVQESNELKKSENTVYIKKPKTIPNKEFKMKETSKKNEIKLLDKNYENYDKKQKALGKEKHKKKETTNSSSDKNAERTDKRTKERNSVDENQEENEYIKLYSKIKSDEKLNNLKNDLDNKNKTNDFGNKNKNKYKSKKKEKKSQSDSESSSDSQADKDNHTIDYSSDFNKKNEKNKSKEKLKNKNKSKFKNSNKSKREESEESNSEDKEINCNYQIEKEKRKINISKKSKKNQNKKEESDEQSDKDHFVNYKVSKKKKSENKHKINIVNKKLRKSFSEKIYCEKESDESISRDIKNEYKDKNQIEVQDNNKKIGNDKFKTPTIPKKEQYSYKNNEEDSKMLMSSNNYIKTESNLDTHLRKFDKNQGISKNNHINNANYEISNSNAFTINTNQMSNLLKSNNSNTFDNLKEKENLMHKNLEIKSENSLNIISNKNSLKEEISENINYISNKSMSNISGEKVYSNRKKSKENPNKKSISSSNSKNIKFNNININKSEITIEEESNLNINNKSNISKRNILPNQKSLLTNNSNIPDEYGDLQKNNNKAKISEENFDDYGQFDYDYNTSNSKVIPSLSNFIDEEIIEEDFN